MHRRGPALVAFAAAVAFALSLTTVSGAVAQVPPLPDLVPGQGDPSPTGSPSTSPSSSGDPESVEQDGPEPNHPVSDNRISDHPDISSDGTQVIFDSHFHEFVSGDSNVDSDVFVRNRSAKTTTIASRTSSGAQGPDGSYDPSISGDGRFVAWATRSSLVSTDTNGVIDVYVRDQQLGTTVIASVSSSGVGGNADSGTPTMSADGRFVVFDSVATNLVSGDSNNASDVFLRDLVSNITTRVSVKGSNNQLNGPSQRAVVSADGTYVAFSSDSTNAVSGDNNSSKDIFVRDRSSNSTTRVSLGNSGNEGNFASDAPSISDNGRYVSFHSRASNLVSGDLNDDEDVFLRDRVANTTTHISVHDDDVGRGLGSYENSISGNGTKVAFVTFARLVEDDPDYSPDIYVRDLTNNSTIKVSVSSGGEHGNAWSDHPAISGDGNHVSFSSGADNLVAGDNNWGWDIFVHDIPTSETLRVSLADGNTPPVAELTVTPTQGDVNTEFTAELSGQDPDGDSITSEIDWGDGTSESAPSSTHVYASPGQYIISGTATDSSGLASSDDQSVIVCSGLLSGTCAPPIPRSAPDPCLDTAADCPDLPDLKVVPDETRGPIERAVGDVTNAVGDAVHAASKPLTPTGEVLIVSVNAQQVWAKPFKCENFNPRIHVYKDWKSCSPQEREGRLARRINFLAGKTRGGPEGGTGSLPDVLLLQEVGAGDLVSIRARLETVTNVPWGIAAGRDGPPAVNDKEAGIEAWCSDPGNRAGRSEQRCVEDVRLEADTAIMFNAATMVPLAKSKTDLTYSYAQKAPCGASAQDATGALFDEDDDGTADCERIKWKRSYSALLAKWSPSSAQPFGPALAPKVAVTSTHMVTDTHLTAAAHESKKRAWAEKLSNHLRVEYGGTFNRFYSIGGDFNIHRCLNRDEAHSEYDYYPPTPPPGACVARDWWALLDGSTAGVAEPGKAFDDATWRANREVDDSLHAQFRDGCLAINQGVCDPHQRLRRIDYIFAGVTQDFDIIDASFDLSCGERYGKGAVPPHCDDLHNPERYSDHRLQWVVVKRT